MKLLFVQQKHKPCEMAFLTSRSVSKHVPCALGIDPTARGAGKSGGSDLLQCRARLVAVDVPSLHCQSSQDVKQILLL